MRVSYDWLKTMIDVPEDPKTLSDEYIRTGTEVEAIDTVGESFDHVVTAKVLTKTPHPDSDHMYVCSVDVGDKNLDADGNPAPLQIVCGAQNFEAGDHIVTAMIGAVLPGDVKIKKSKLRGVVSMGMNCSARELGLGGDHSGIMILPEDTPCGMPFAEYVGSSDTVLDCEITPNRPDCLSVTGLVDPHRLTANDTGRPGDKLLLTKALGVGLICTANRVGEAAPEQMEAAVRSMTTLNKTAAEISRKYRVHAATDVTGFSFLGHLHEMMGGKLSCVIHANAVPVLPGAEKAADAFLYTAAGQRNRNHTGPFVRFKNVSFAMEEVLFDPQTSGGLLFAVDPADAATLEQELRAAGLPASIVGEILPKQEIEITVTDK